MCVDKIPEPLARLFDHGEAFPLCLAPSAVGPPQDKEKKHGGGDDEVQSLERLDHAETSTYQ